MVEPNDKQGVTTASARLLLIDDEAPHWAGMFDQGLKPLGFELSIEDRAPNALKSVGENDPDVILLDLHFPGDDVAVDGATTGGRLLVDIRDRYPEIPVVVFTTLIADEDIPLEVFGSQPHGKFSKHQIAEKQRAGVPWAPVLASALREAMEVARLEREPVNADLGFVAGSTKAMRHVVALVRKYARYDETVLIYGETGTGKQGVAKAIHRLSGRDGTFEYLNCSGIHEETLTDLLFGHVKGAFSGAVGERAGMFEQGSGGTLFLDEIQEMPASLQNHLMSVVEVKVLRRMGSNRDVEVDTRLIVATNQLPAALVADEVLREDLAFRLNQFPIALPPLRERMQDLPELSGFLLRRANETLNRDVTDLLRPEVMDKLRAYDWPGNIRELDTVLKRAVATTTSNVLLPEDIQITPWVTASGAKVQREDDEGDVQAAGEAMDTQAEKIAAIASEIDELPIRNRYSYITGNVNGNLRREVLVYIVCRLRDELNVKISHKRLANYLDEIEDPEKDYERIRQMVISAGVRLTQLECNK